MSKSKRIESLVAILRMQFSGESTGHDWFHLERVWRNAKLIAQEEQCDLEVLQLGALLHDIADHKFVDDYSFQAEVKVRDLLGDHYAEDTIQSVLHIVENCSFKGGVSENKMKSKEGLIVQDADRLDAIGAIGIARTFAFGGKFGNEIYNPDVDPSHFQTEEEYRNKRTHTINHFYEKLLLLKDNMNTNSARKIAEERHLYMEKFLEQFYAEWKGEK